MIELEYDLILGEDDDTLLFLVDGREVRVAKERLVRYDHEGRFTLRREDAVELGLIGEVASP